MSAPEMPSAAKSLLRQLGYGWTVHTNHGIGDLEFGALSEDEDGNGKRKRITVLEPVDSVLVRARHDDGRAFVAVWVHRLSRKGWTLDMAWRGRHPCEYAPRQLTATQLKAYVAAEDRFAALEAVKACAPKAKAEAA